MRVHCLRLICLTWLSREPVSRGYLVDLSRVAISRTCLAWPSCVFHRALISGQSLHLTSVLYGFFSVSLVSDLIPEHVLINHHSSIASIIFYTHLFDYIHHSQGITHLAYGIHHLASIAYISHTFERNDIERPTHSGALGVPNPFSMRNRSPCPFSRQWPRVAFIWVGFACLHHFTYFLHPVFK